MSPAPRRGRRNQNDGRIDLSLFGMSDTELLARVDDLADENGWTHTADVRLAIGEHPGVSARPRHTDSCSPAATWP